MIFVTFQTLNELFNDFSKSDTFSTNFPCSIIHPYNCVVLYESKLSLLIYQHLCHISNTMNTAIFSHLNDWLLPISKHFAPSRFIPYLTNGHNHSEYNSCLSDSYNIIQISELLLKLHWCWITWLIEICNTYLVFNDIFLRQTSDF